ncbi:MAG: outer membrane beta-barrel protein [Aliarcobacter sp.]|nr:outer membrane beta-barrel protein [Aliarcobacter sp.]
MEIHQLVALNLAYDLTTDLTLEANLAHHNIKDATFSGINKDLKITEYDAGLSYKLNKSAELSLRYALGTFDESSLEDMQTVVGAVTINF